MIKQIILLAFICFLLLISIQCSSNDVAGGSTDIEVSGVTQNSGGDDIGNGIVSLLPDSFSFGPLVDTPDEFIDTTNEKGEFFFAVPNTGSYTLYIIDTLNHESYYQKSIQIDSSINLGTIINSPTANLLINIPTSFQVDSGYCIIPGTQRRVTFTPTQQTITFPDIPSDVEFPIILNSYNDSILYRKTMISPITAGETDTLSSAIRVLYIIDTTTIKESHPVDLADSLGTDENIEVTITTKDNFQGSDTAFYDIIYIASNVDQLVNTKWYPLVLTSKPVICASSGVYSLINLADNTLSDTGSETMNSVTKMASGWNSLFPDSTIGTNESFNLFSSDTLQKFTVEWGVPNANAKIAVQGAKPLLFFYEKGAILPDDNKPANGIRVAIFGCNVQQFNSQAIQIIRNTITQLGK